MSAVGQKRTSRFVSVMSAVDPKRTSQVAQTLLKRRSIRRAVIERYRCRLRVGTCKPSVRIQLGFKCGNLDGVVAQYRGRGAARLRDHLTLTRY